jgi:hypothetical protein
VGGSPAIEIAATQTKPACAGSRFVESAQADLVRVAAISIAAISIAGVQSLAFYGWLSDV